MNDADYRAIAILLALIAVGMIWAKYRMGG